MIASLIYPFIIFNTGPPKPLTTVCSFREYVNDCRDEISQEEVHQSHELLWIIDFCYKGF